LGTASSPANESISSSFELSASESGYHGSFSARTIVGQCWVVQPPTSGATSFDVAPTGLLCEGGLNGDTEQIQVSDSNGNSVITFIHSI
jgi:hypothetical protein